MQLLLWRLARHRHETHGQRGTLFQLAIFLFQQVQLLSKSVTDGNNHAPVVFKLIDERLRNFVRRACHDDGIERRHFRPAFVTITDFQMHIFIAEPLQCRLGIFRQRFDYLDGVNL